MLHGPHDQLLSCLGWVSKSSGNPLPSCPNPAARAVGRTTNPPFTAAAELGSHTTLPRKENMMFPPPHAKCCLIIQLMKRLILKLQRNYGRKEGEEESLEVFLLLRVTKQPVATGQPMQPEVSDEELGWKASAFLENPWLAGPCVPLGVCWQAVTSRGGFS